MMLWSYLMLCSYIEPKDLFLKTRPGETVRAERGVEQGDPWGPFLFALVFAWATEQIAPLLTQRTGGQGLLVLLLDDLSVVAPLGIMAEVCPLLRAALASLGLSFPLLSSPGLSWSLLNLSNCTNHASF